MEPFLIRILIAIGIIWLAQTILNELGIQEPARKIVFLVILVVSVLYALFGTAYILR